jgi:hypothetical protein
MPPVTESIWVSGKCGSLNSRARASDEDTNGVPSIFRSRIMLPLAPQPAWPVLDTVTHAAVVSFCLLQSVLPGLVLAHETGEGGVICEHRCDGFRPGFYLVTAAGAIEPDQVLDRRSLRFVPGLLPAPLRSGH